MSIISDNTQINLNNLLKLVGELPEGCRGDSESNRKIQKICTIILSDSEKLVGIAEFPQVKALENIVVKRDAAHLFKSLFSFKSDTLESLKNVISRGKNLNEEFLSIAMKHIKASEWLDFENFFKDLGFPRLSDFTYMISSKQPLSANESFEIAIYLKQLGIQKANMILTAVKQPSLENKKEQVVADFFMRLELSLFKKS